MIKRRIRTTLKILLAIFILNPWTLTASADDFHEEPNDFLFGNHIDTHQETKLKLKKGEPDSLKGFLYIIDTGRTTDEGLPIYRHPRGAGYDEECGVDPIECEVGWKIKAVPGEAKFLYHSGVNGNDHPVRKGVENTTHLNLVTNYSVVVEPEITSTRPPEGSH